MNPENLIGKVPWLTKDGCLDLAKFPIDSVLAQALDADKSFTQRMRDKFSAVIARAGDLGDDWF